MARRSIAKEIEAGLHEIVADVRGEGPALKTYTLEVPDVRAIREGMDLSQSEFGARFGLNPRTVQGWEQKRLVPLI